MDTETNGPTACETNGSVDSETNGAADIEKHETKGRNGTGRNETADIKVKRRKEFETIRILTTETKENQRSLKQMNQWMLKQTK